MYKLSTFLLAGSVLSTVLVACQNSSEATTEQNKTSQAETTQIVQDTLKPVQVSAYSVPIVYAGKTALTRLVDPKGAPVTPDMTIVIPSDNWAYRIGELMGRIVKATADTGTNSGTAKLLDFTGNRITGKTYKPAIETPTDPKTDERTITKDNSIEISFMGISPNMTNKQSYQYEATLSSLCSISDTDIDKTKIPAAYKCANDDCSYYYIAIASVKTCKTTLYSEHGKKLTVSQLPLGGNAIPLNGTIYTGSTNRDYSKKNLVFCSLVRLPK